MARLARLNPLNWAITEQGLEWWDGRARREKLCGEVLSEPGGSAGDDDFELIELHEGPPIRTWRRRTGLPPASKPRE